MSPSRALSCRFGHVAVGATFVSEHELSCQPPPNLLAGTSNVTVSLNGEDFSPTLAAFEVTPYVRVAAVSPISGALEGGTEVLLLGEEFQAGAVCRFGRDAAPVPATFLTPDSVRCTSPPRARPGTVGLQVSNNGLDYTTSGTVVHYHAAPRVVQLALASGPTAGEIAPRLARGLRGGGECAAVASERRRPGG